MYRNGLKRLIDLAILLLCLPIVLPVVAIVAVAVLIRLGRPIFFTQMRPGRNGIPFQMRKFRTMLNTRDEQGNLLPDAERLTAFGRFLRATSLDELPELLNVLVGHMSLVGPRPLLMEYLPLYSAEQARRHHVRPGITGWAQINGRNAISWEEKFELDVWYVDHQSFWLDLAILVRTVLKTLQRADINQAGQATMEKFEGSPVK